MATDYLGRTISIGDKYALAGEVRKIDSPSAGIVLVVPGMEPIHCDAADIVHVDRRDSSDDVVIGSSGANDLVFHVGTLGEAARIKAVTGHVGIGGAPSGGSAILKTYGFPELLNTGSGVQKALELANRTTAAANVGSSLSFTGEGGFTLSTIQSFWDGAATTDATLDLRVRASNALASFLRVNGTGVRIEENLSSGANSLLEVVGSSTTVLEVDGDTKESVGIRAGAEAGWSLTVGGKSSGSIYCEDVPNYDFAVGFDFSGASSQSGFYVNNNRATVRLRDGSNVETVRIDAGADSWFDTGHQVGFGTTVPTRMVDIVAANASQLRLRSTETDSSTKNGYIQVGHYTNAEQDVDMIRVSSSGSSSVLSLGGGSTALNAVTQVNLYVASNNITTLGTQVACLQTAGLMLDLTGCTGAPADTLDVRGDARIGDGAISSISTKLGGASDHLACISSTTALTTVACQLNVDESSRDSRAEFFLTDNTAGNGAWGLWFDFGTAGGQPFVIGSESTTWFEIDSGDASVPAGTLSVTDGAGSAATATLNQSSSTGAQVCLKLDQDDADVAFIDFDGSSGADATSSISTRTTPGSTLGFLKIEFDGGTEGWLRVYGAPLGS